MNNKLYTIGCKIVNRKTKEVVDGLFVMGSLGLPHVHSSGLKCQQGDTIYLIEGADNAKKLVQYFAKAYKSEFKTTVKRTGMGMENFKFYPLKITNPLISNYYTIDVEKKKESKAKLDGIYYAPILNK